MNNTNENHDEEKIEIVEMDPIFIIDRGPTEIEYARATEFEVPIITFVTEELCPHAEDFAKWYLENIPPLRFLSCHYVKSALVSHAMNEAKQSFRQDRENQKQIKETVLNPIKSLFDQIIKGAGQKPMNKPMPEKPTENTGFQGKSTEQILKDMFPDPEQPS